MNKNIILVFSLTIVFSIFFTSSIITGLSTYQVNLSTNINPIYWEEDIPDIIIFQNSSSFIVDSDLSNSGNGFCNSYSDQDNTTFTISDETSSKVDCNIDDVKLSIIPNSSFAGSTICEVTCNEFNFSETINFTINVLEDLEPESEVVVVSSGGGGGGGISRAQLANILGQNNIFNIAVNPESIKLKLRPGETISEIISIENKLDKIYDINIAKNTLVSYVKIKNEHSLEPKSTIKIPIEIGIPLNEYRSIITGTIDFDEYTDLAVVIEVINPLLDPDSQQEVELLITLGTDYISPTLIFTGEIDKKNILPGTLLKPRIKLTEFYQSGYPEISLTYYLFDMNNNELLSFTDYYKTYDDRTLSILLPEDIPLGEYALTFEAKYGNFVSRNTQTLQIVSSKGLLTDELIILTLMVGVMAYSIYAISTRRKRGGNKRNKQKTNAKLIYH